MSPRRDGGGVTPAQSVPIAKSSLSHSVDEGLVDSRLVDSRLVDSRLVDSRQIEGLISQLENGSAIAEAKLVGLSHQDSSAQILNGLAQSAANGSPYSMELLLRFVVEQKLAAAAIASVTRTPAVIEDIHQEVLVAISDSIHRFRGDAKFTTWLYTLARNVSVSHLRRIRPTSALAETDLEEADHRRRMSSLVVERDALRDAIAELPQKYRDTVVMRDLHGLSYAEIAERQGLEISTIRTRLHRGRAMLAIKLP